MRTKIDTTGVQFRTASQPRPKKFKDDEPQATTQDGRPIWVIKLDAIETDRQAKESIWVEVAGDEPKVPFDDFVTVTDLVYAPYVSKKTGKIGRKFRAEAITAVNGKAAHAA
jgi:hypothetical protein